jgi:imidazolonepropionase
MRELGIIPDGAVLVVDGRIQAVGQGRRVENLAAARNALEIDARGKVVLPAFVDSYCWPLWGWTHPAEAPPRAFAGGGVQDWHSIEPWRSFREIPSTPSRTLQRRLRLALEDFVRHGVTTIEAKTGWGLDARGHIKSLRVLAGVPGLWVDLLSSVLLDGPAGEASAGQGESLEEQARRFLPEAARRHALRFVEVCPGKGVMSVEAARRCLLAARGLGLQLRVNAGRSGHPAVRLALETDAVSVAAIDHATQDDLAALADRGTVVILLPAVALNLGFPPLTSARFLIDRGVAVALATGYSPCLNPAASMQHVLWAACRFLHMQPAEALAAATVNAAYALGCGAQCGSLEAGKRADLAIFDTSDYREIVYCGAENLVLATIKGGSVLYQRGEVRWPEL